MENAETMASLRLPLTLVLFFAGLAIGPFLGKVCERVPYDISLWTPSVCPTCKKKLRLRDMLPVIGWIRLGGACSACDAPISRRFPILEAVTGIVWAVQGWRLAAMPPDWQTLALGVLELAFVSSLIVTVVIDWDCLIILDEISLGGAAVALAASPLLPRLHHAATPETFARYSPELYLLFGAWPAWARSLGASAIGLAAGLGFSLLAYWFGNIAFARKIEQAREEDPEMDSVLGLGDVKLMAFIGAFLGWWAVIMVFLIGALAGAVGGAAIRLATGDAGSHTGLAAIRHRWQSGDSFIPFGPFLALGAWVML